MEGQNVAVFGVCSTGRDLAYRFEKVSVVYLITFRQRPCVALVMHMFFTVAKKSCNVYPKVSRTANDFFREKSFLEKPGSQAVESNNPEQQMIAWESLRGIPRVCRINPHPSS
jgi:hypothetical protein